MAHEENQNTVDSIESCDDNLKTTQQKLTDAHSEIADLKLQLAWLERSYE